MRLAHHLISRRTWSVLAVLVLDGLFFGITNPNKINPIIIITSFILLILSLYGVIRAFLYALSLTGIVLVHRKRASIFVAIVAALLIALQSIGQLTLRDVLVIVPLSALIYGYIVYVRPKADTQ